MTLEQVKEILRSRRSNSVISQEAINGLREAVGLMNFDEAEGGVMVALINDYERLSNELMDQGKYLDQLGEVDPNLQMTSRNSIFRNIEREWEGSKRYHSPTSLIMFGIDGIENMTEPTQIQQIYKELAAIIDTSTRMTDTFGRLDDVQFLIIVPTTNNFQASWLSGKLRETIERHTFESGVHLTASFGVADSGASMDPEDWLLITEEAFKKARISGGNIVVDYESMIEK